MQNCDLVLTNVGPKSLILSLLYMDKKQFQIGVTSLDTLFSAWFPFNIFDTI